MKDDSERPAPQWTREEAVELCKRIEAVCVPFGCHVALTGGALYKDGPRKDADVLFYRIRQVEKIDTDGLFAELASIGIVKTGGFGWCHKASFEGRNIDCFFPEDDGGEYAASRQVAEALAHLDLDEPAF